MQKIERFLCAVMYTSKYVCHKFVIYIYMFNKEMIHITLIVFIVEIVEADSEGLVGLH